MCNTGTRIFPLRMRQLAAFGLSSSCLSLGGSRTCMAYKSSWLASLSPILLLSAHLPFRSPPSVLRPAPLPGLCRCPVPAAPACPFCLLNAHNVQQLSQYVYHSPSSHAHRCHFLQTAGGRATQFDLSLLQPIVRSKRTPIACTECRRRQVKVCNLSHCH